MKIERIIADITQTDETEGDRPDEVMKKLKEEVVREKQEENIIVAFLAREGKSEVKETEDAWPKHSNGDFNNRETFIEVCEEKNYQFGNLQRAKHASIMLLGRVHQSLPS